MDNPREKNIARDEVRRKTLSAAAAATMLGKRPHRSEVFRIIRLLDNRDPVIRQAAIRNLAQLGGADATSSITRCLNDGDYRVRAAACQALGQMRAHVAKNYLYDMLADRNAYVRCAAAAALASMGDQYGLPTVAKLVCLNGPHQIEALRCLNRITRKTFILTRQGVLQAIDWIRLHKKDILKF